MSEEGGGECSAKEAVKRSEEGGGECSEEEGVRSSRCCVHDTS